MVTAPPQGPEWISILDLDFFGALNRDDVDFRFGKWSSNGRGDLCFSVVGFTPLSLPFLE
jgi:hypothetical protein